MLSRGGELITEIRLSSINLRPQSKRLCRSDVCRTVGRCSCVPQALFTVQAPFRRLNHVRYSNECCQLFESLKYDWHLRLLKIIRISIISSDRWLALHGGAVLGPVAWSASKQTTERNRTEMKLKWNWNKTEMYCCVDNVPLPYRTGNLLSFECLETMIYYLWFKFLIRLVIRLGSERHSKVLSKVLSSLSFDDNYLMSSTNCF